MRLLSLQTISEANAPATQVATSQPGSDPYAATLTWAGAPDRQISSQELIDANNMVQALRADKFRNMTIEQKLDLVLKQVATAEQAAYQALQQVSAFDQKLTQVMASLSQTPPPTTTSRQTHADNESIFGY